MRLKIYFLIAYNIGGAFHDARAAMVVISAAMVICDNNQPIFRVISRSGFHRLEQAIKMCIVDLHRSAVEGIIVAEFVVMARMVANFKDGEDQICAVGIPNLFECALLYVEINAVILNQLEINRQIIFLAILDFRSIGAVCFIEMPALEGKEGRFID